MAVISEKTRIPLGLAIGLLTTAIPAVFFLATARADTQIQQTRIEKMERTTRGLERSLSDMQSDIAVIKTQMEFQTQALKDIKEDLRRR